MEFSSVKIKRTKKNDCKETILGWIPSEWQIKKLKVISENGLSNGTFNDPEKRGAGYRLINVVDLYSEPKIDTSNLSKLELSKKEFKRNKVSYEELLFTRSSLKLEGIAHCNINLDDSDDLTYDDHIMKMTVDKKQVLPRYLRLFCLTNIARNHFMRLAKQTTMTTISQKDVIKLPVLIPPLDEQNSIINILSKWDEAILTIKDKVQAKKRYKKGLMQQLLSPNGSGQAGKKRFPEFEGEEWMEVKIGGILNEVKRDVDWDDSALYDLISVKRRSGGIVHRESLYGHEIKTKNLKTVKKGDFIISRMQVLHGASALASEEFEGTKVSGSYHTLVARNPDKFSVKYFNYLSQTPYLYHLAYISSHGVHIEKMTFKIDDYLKKKIKIPPSKKEQDKIVDVLDAADKEISLLQKELEAIKKQKKGLMQQLLTGKVRVNQKEADYAL